MLISNLSNKARKKLLEFGFTENSDINCEQEGGNALYGWFSFTPLMYAAYQGEGDIVQELVQNGAELNKTDEFFKFTALMWAAWEGRDKVVEHLLAAGADSTYESNYRGKSCNAYSLSKKESCCSFVGFLQRVKKVVGTADVDHTHEILNPNRKIKRC